MPTAETIPRRVRIAFPGPPGTTGFVAAVLFILALTYVLLRI